MFVPVSCTHCGKPFQVPEAALGKLAPCPWCQTVVAALPVSAPVAEQPAPTPAPAPAKVAEPLSLDDEPNRPVAIPVAPPSARVRRNRSTTATTARPVALSRVLVTVLVGMFLVAAVMALTIVLRNYGGGRVSDSGWTEFTPPDGTFRIALPDTPTEEDVAANPEGSVTGGKRFLVRGRYSKTAVWVAYTDLAPALVPKLPTDKDRIVTAGVLRVERDREVSRLKGTVTKEVEMRMDTAWGVSPHMDTPHGNVIEWLFLKGDGPHPRLYAFGVEGKDLTPTTPACAKLFGTFRAIE